MGLKGEIAEPIVAAVTGRPGAHAVRDSPLTPRLLALARPAWHQMAVLRTQVGTYPHPTLILASASSTSARRNLMARPIL